MRAALGSQRADPGVVGQEEEWEGPTADDEEVERNIEGWYWEGEAKGDG